MNKKIIFLSIIPVLIFIKTAFAYESAGEYKFSMKNNLPITISIDQQKLLNEFIQNNWHDNGSLYQIRSIDKHVGYYFIFIASLDGDYSDPEFIGTGKAGKLFILDDSNNIYIENTSDFNNYLFKQNDINQKSIDRFSHNSDNNSRQTVTVNYKFPWPEGEQRYVGRSNNPWHGWHCLNTDTHCALDFVVSHDPLSDEDKTVLAASNASVIVMCEDTSTNTVNIRLVDDNGLKTEYFHITKGTQTVQTGDIITQGTLLGKTWAGNLSSDCEDAGAIQKSYTTHLHWVLPTDPIYIDGWLIDHPSKCFKKGTLEECSSSTHTVYFTSSNNELCSPPNNSDWTISNEICELSGNHTIYGNLNLINNAQLKLTSASVNIDFLSHHVFIENQSKLIIDSNSKLF